MWILRNVRSMYTYVDLRTMIATYVFYNYTYKITNARMLSLLQWLLLLLLLLRRQHGCAALPRVLGQLPQRPVRLVQVIVHDVAVPHDGLCGLQLTHGAAQPLLHALLGLRACEESEDRRLAGLRTCWHTVGMQ